MSYGINLYIDTGSEDGHAEVEECGGTTSNVGPMFRLAMPARESMPGRYWGTGEPQPGTAGVPGLSGMTCSDAIPVLDEGIKYFEDHKEELEKLNPENGWGNYEGALRVLRNLRTGCARHPRAYIGVNW